MLYVRRIHLYSGLFMLPWVLLYGFTGWFFNHPRYFTGHQRTVIDALEVVDGQLANLPTAASVAERVVEEISLESFLIDGPVIELPTDQQAFFRGYMTFNANGQQQSHVVTVHPVTGMGEIRTTFNQQDTSEKLHTSDSRPINPLIDIDNVDAGPNPQTIASEVLPEALDELGLESSEAFVRRGGTDLVFRALVDGELCKVTYNLASGSVSASYLDAKSGPIMTKSFLQRLHLSRGYAPHLGVRTWWAIAVDAMFVSMVFWGLSGVLMWWQIKKTRWLGMAVLIVSVATATLMALEMHEELRSRGRGRGGGGHAGRPTAQVSSPTNSAPAIEATITSDL